MKFNFENENKDHMVHLDQKNERDLDEVVHDLNYVSRSGGKKIALDNLPNQNSESNLEKTLRLIYDKIHNDDPLQHYALIHQYDDKDLYNDYMSHKDEIEKFLESKNFKVRYEKKNSSENMVNDVNMIKIFG